MRAGGHYIADPGRLLQEMRPSTWGLWRALYAIDPWDEQRADLRQAIATAALVQAQGARRVGGGSFSYLDFMPYVERPPEKTVDLHKRLRAAFGVPPAKKGV